MKIEEVPIDSPIETKISWAENYYHEIGNTFLEDERIDHLLERLKGAIQASREEMIRAGVANECENCEKREGGSCCGAGMEDRYNGILILINLLLGVKIPKKRDEALSCFFLGQEGCLLLARQVICVNYLCKKITDRIDTQKISSLREKEGVELELLFFLHERIKKILMS